MFYKFVLNNKTVIYNLSKVYKVELHKNCINLYYHYNKIIGNFIYITSYADDEKDTIKCSCNEEALEHFDAIQKQLK